MTDFLNTRIPPSADLSGLSYFDGHLTHVRECAYVVEKCVKSVSTSSSEAVTWFSIPN